MKGAGREGVLFDSSMVRQIELPFPRAQQQILSKGPPGAGYCFSR